MKTENSRNNAIIFLLLTMIGLSSSCNKDDPDSVQMPEPSPAIIINSINPTKGPFGTEMTIKGKHFPDGDSLQVRFNGAVANVKILTTDTLIVVKVPKKAGVGPITVKSAKDSARSVDFNYEFTPVVTTIAGTGDHGFKDGPSSEAQFYNPIGITGLDDGNLYVADFITTGYGR